MEAEIQLQAEALPTSGAPLPVEIPFAYTALALIWPLVCIAPLLRKKTPIEKRMLTFSILSVVSMLFFVVLVDNQLLTAMYAAPSYVSIFLMDLLGFRIQAENPFVLMGVFLYPLLPLLCMMVFAPKMKYKKLRYSSVALFALISGQFIVGCTILAAVLYLGF